MWQQDEEETEEQAPQEQGDVPPLPGHKEHRCTDTPCLVIFVIALALQIFIVKYALENGDIRKLTRGYDAHGRLCGVDTEGDVLFHCRSPGEEGEFIMRQPICIDACPQAGNTTHSCFTPTVGALVEYPDYDTYQVLNYCVPNDVHGLKRFLKGKLGDATAALKAHKSVLRMMKRLFASALATVKRAWLPLVIASNIAVITGYVYIFLLDKMALHLVYACEFVVVCGSWALGLLLLKEAFTGGSDNLPDTGDSFLDLGAGLIVILGGCIGLCISVCINRSLPTAVGCIEATCECMFQEPTLLLEPFAALAQKAVLTTGYIYLILHIVATGELNLNNVHDGFQRNFHHDAMQKFFLTFTCVMFIWAMGIAHSLTQYALAWTTQMWYFTPYIDGVKLDRKACAVFRAYCSAFRYHMGSIALGGFCAVTFGLARICIRPVAKAANMKNPISRCIALACFFCVSAYWSFLVKIKKTAYMDIAITSSNFCPAATRSLEILANEVPALHVLSGAQFVFQLVLLGVMCYTSFTSTLFITKNIPTFCDQHSPHYIEEPNIVAFFAAGIGGLVGISFALVFDTVGDTILYCFATEQRRHREVDASKYKEENNTSFFGWLFYGEDQEEDEERVDYAPQRLRALIKRRPAGDSDSDSD